MNTAKKINVLHLARWYPHRYDPMFGLFVKRHIEAVSNYVNATVVYAQKTTDKSDNKYLITETDSNGFKEIIVYYRIAENSPSFIKLYKYITAIYKGIKFANAGNDKFQIVHVHILTRLGIVALFLKFFWKTPYIITEHWSRYLPVTGYYKGNIRKLLTKIAVKNAGFVTTVTKNLALAMQQRGLTNKNYKVLHNVINPLFFKQYDKPVDNITRFVHISCFEDRSKNISGILRVISKLSKQRDDFKFVLIGDGKDFDKLKRYAENLEIPEKVIEFTGLLEGENLAQKMATCDITVIFSNYENLPVVINESFALGIPVVATKTGGIAEIVDEEKGILINVNDEEKLFETLTGFIDKKFSFNSEHLKTFAKNNFSYQAIGKQIFDIYKNIINL